MVKNFCVLYQKHKWLTPLSLRKQQYIPGTLIVVEYQQYWEVPLLQGEEGLSTWKKLSDLPSVSCEALIKQPPAKISVSADPKPAAQADYTGHYSNSSLRPVSTYVQRPALHQQLKGQLHDKITEKRSGTTILVVQGLGG